VFDETTLDDTTSRPEGKPMNKPVIVGIAGGGGSGKTSIAKAVQETLGTQTLLIHLDDWRITDQSNGPFNTSPSNGIRYFDFNHPDSVDLPRVMQEISSATAKVIIVEGTFGLHFAELREVMTCKIFVDADDDLRVLRKIMRNQITRGQSFETSIRNHLEGGRIGHLKYIAPAKKFADLIINGEADVDQNCMLLTALIRGLLV
jgi:uridine kinase